MVITSTQEQQNNVQTPDRNFLLSVEDLHVWFELKRFGFGHAGYVRAVDGVTFQVQQGESIAIVGESGCGKSTLMKTILALHKPIKGKIVFNGKNIFELDKQELKRYCSQVGYVQQDPYGALPPFMTVQRILEEPLIISGVKDRKERLERVYQVLEEVKLTPIEDFLKKYPHMLSGGQQQRVVIARAMILEPKFLVADEPVSMLDASVRVEILKLLRNLQEIHHLSIIYITHDLSTVSYFSERIFVMYAGHLIEKGKVRQILDDPLHPYTTALLNGTSEPDARNAETYKEIPPGEPPSLIHPPAGCRFHPRCSKRIEGVCNLQQPPYFEPQPQHLVKCWLYDEHVAR